MYFMAKQVARYKIVLHYFINLLKLCKSGNFQVGKISLFLQSEEVYTQEINYFVIIL